MKYLALCLLLTGCGYDQHLTLRAATRACAKDGGVNVVAIQLTKYFVRCNNGAEHTGDRE